MSANRRDSVVRASVAGIAAAALGIAYVIFRNGGWVYDDNLLLVFARNAGLNLHWLNRVIFQHWDVGMNATYSMMVHLFPFDYRWALVALLAILGVAIYCFERILALVGVPAWLRLVLVVWFGFSILWTRQLQWWAAGVQELPTLLCDLVCLYGFLRFHLDGRRGWIVTSAVALAVGLAFYEKPALMLLYLALIRVLLMSEKASPRHLASTFWRERRLWLTYCAIVAIWAVGYVGSGAPNGVVAGRVGIDGYLDYFRIMWVNTLTPALAGFTLPAGKLSMLQAVGAIGLQLALLGMLVLSIHRKPTAWRAWALIATAVMLDGGLVAYARVAQFGVGVGNDLRYLTDFGWLIPFALGYAVSSKPVMQPASVSTERRVLSPAHSKVYAAGIIVLLSAYGVMSTATAARLQKDWNSVQARHWEDNLEQGFATLAHERVRPVVADEALPFQIISAAFAPDNRLSQLLPLYVGKVQVDGPLDGPLVRIDTAGNVQPAVIARGASGIARLGPMRTDGAQGAKRVSHRSGSVCIAAGVGDLALAARVTRAVSPNLASYYAVLHYTSSQAFAIPMLEDSGRGYPGMSPDRIVVAARARTSIAWLHLGFPRRLKLIVPSGRRLCIQRLEVVGLSSR